MSRVESHGFTFCQNYFVFIILYKVLIELFNELYFISILRKLNGFYVRQLC